MKKKILLTTLLFCFPIIAKAEPIQHCSNIELDEKQIETALAMTLKTNIEDVDCDTINFVSTLISSTINYNTQFVYNPDSINPLAVELYNGVYNMILTSQNDDGKYIAVATVLCDNENCIYSKGKWQFVGITWLPGTSQYGTGTNDGYYTKSGNVTVYPDSRLLPVIGVSQSSNLHNGALSAYKMPKGSVTHSMYHYTVTYNSQPSSVCMGYYYLKSGKSISVSNLHSWFVQSYGSFYWNGTTSTQTNQYFNHNQLCM